MTQGASAHRKGPASHAGPLLPRRAQECVLFSVSQLPWNVPLRPRASPTLTVGCALRSLRCVLRNQGGLGARVDPCLVRTQPLRRVAPGVA